MRYKILAIIFLLLAIAWSAQFGTFSSFTVSSSFGATADADSEKLDERFLKPDPAQPDLENLPSAASVFGQWIVVKKENISNSALFIAFTGNIIQENDKASLSITGGGVYGFYLVYFNPGTQILFSDGTSIELGGFYTITSANGRINIFDASYYTINGSTRVLKDGNGSFEVCVNFVETAQMLGIPLI